MAYTRVSADLMALRTSVIDAAVKAAVARGIRQLVILGAGFDGRAWRMRELSGVRVFEVDHPATQAAKRSHVGELPKAIADVAFVSVDFERVQLDGALERAGHDRSQPTCWIWEGVVMYLTHDAMRASLATIAARSARDSTVIVNYHTSTRGWFVRLIFQLIGEPVRSKWSPQEMAADLRALDFTVEDDSGMQEWAKRFAVGAVRIKPGRIMRVVVARKA